MTRILWVSRHKMTEPQRTELDRIYEDVSLMQYDATVQDINEILAFHADVYAVVLPLGLLAELRKNTDAEIIQSVSGRIRKESDYVFQHLYWQKINKLVLETENL